MSEYDAYAEFYDTIYADYDVDVPFYVAEALRAGSPVLELACGTGRVAIRVAQAGVEVVGIDSSPAMLERFRARLPGLSPIVRKSITLVEADMRDFDLGVERFNLIYCPFRAFLHLLTVEDQLAALQMVYRHLKPNGRFALNFFNPSVPLIAESLTTAGFPVRRTREFINPATGNKVIEHFTVRHDVVEQLIRQYFIYDEIDANGQVVKRTYKPMTLRWIYRYEFEHLLARCGFEVEALYGTFDRQPFTHGHGELIWIARKR